MPDRDELRQVIAERVREARRLSGLSQNAVATKMGWHRPTVSQIEAGDRNLGADEAVALAQLFEVDLEWLLGKEEASDHVAARLKLAARELNKLKKDDLDRLLQILASMRREPEN